MTTSGTVGTTTVDTAKLLEHAFRRCRVKPALQTPELVASARESLYMLLIMLANRGLNLWCVGVDYIGLGQGQATYVTPVGTIDVLNVIYSQPTQATGTDTSTVTSKTTELSVATEVKRIGVKLSAVTAADTLTLASSTDGITYTTIQTEVKTDWTTGTWYWFDLDPTVTDTFFKASFVAAATLSELYLASAVNDLPITQWNRDTYSVMNDKHRQGRPCTTYYLEKLLTPRITLWPVPDNNYDHLTIFRQRQVQDVGTLTQSIEVPQRWVEGIVWQLASRVAFEVDTVQPELMTLIKQMADASLIEVERDETDGAPIFLQPNIRGYSA